MRSPATFHSSEFSAMSSASAASFSFCAMVRRGARPCRPWPSRRPDRRGRGRRPAACPVRQCRRPRRRREAVPSVLRRTHARLRPPPGGTGCGPRAARFRWPGRRNAPRSGPGPPPGCRPATIRPGARRRRCAPTRCRRRRRGPTRRGCSCAGRRGPRACRPWPRGAGAWLPVGDRGGGRASWRGCCRSWVLRPIGALAARHGCRITFLPSSIANRAASRRNCFRSGQVGRVDSCA